MATTVSAGFNELRNRLALTDRQKATADSRIETLSSFLASRFYLASEPVVVGSYGRKTIVRPIRDIDLLVALDYGKYETTQAGHDSRQMLYLIRGALNERYHATEVSSQRIAVKLDFTDITVDVVPGYPQQGGGYLVANGSGGWLSTNPPFHTQHVDDAHRKSGSLLKIIIRLMKYWNIVNYAHLSSIHMELTVTEMWSGIDMSGRSVSNLLAATLKVAPSWLSSSCSDPWSGNTQAVDARLSQTDRDVAIKYARADAGSAAAAESYRLAGDDRSAFLEWNKVFRNNFPAYG